MNRKEGALLPQIEEELKVDWWTDSYFWPRLLKATPVSVSSSQTRIHEPFTEKELPTFLWLEELAQVKTFFPNWLFRDNQEEERAALLFVSAEENNPYSLQLEIKSPKKQVYNPETGELEFRYSPQEKEQLLLDVHTHNDWRAFSEIDVKYFPQIKPPLAASLLATPDLLYLWLATDIYFNNYQKHKKRMASQSQKDLWEEVVGLWEEMKEKGEEWAVSFLGLTLAKRLGLVTYSSKDGKLYVKLSA